jgi:2-oxoglutarate ferredoxin oxidoreductase subunit alpha
MTFMTIPSTISGGPSIFQVRIGSGEVLSSGDEADVLLAFYQHSYDDHLHSLKKGGIVVYDSDHVEPKPEATSDYHHIGCRFRAGRWRPSAGWGGTRARTCSRWACWRGCST